MEFATDKEKAQFLNDLVAGKYDRDIFLVQKLLNWVGKFWPPAKFIAGAIKLLVAIQKHAGVVVPDNHGGVVPISNSRVHPTNGRFIKWVGGRYVYDDFLGGYVKEKLKPP